jgi:hypothetical protein
MESQDKSVPEKWQAFLAAFCRIVRFSADAFRFLPFTGWIY